MRNAVLPEKLQRRFSLWFFGNIAGYAGTEIRIAYYLTQHGRIFENLKDFLFNSNRVRSTPKIL